MRVFVALVPPVEIQNAIMSGFAVTNGSIRKSPVHQLHLTLAFYADLDPAHLSTLFSAVDASCAVTESFEISFADITFFPNPKRARVCVLEIQDGTSRLQAFQESLVRLSPAGFDVRPFSPHLTLARLGESCRSTDCLWQAQYRFAFTAKSCIVYESNPREGGFVHHSRYQSYFKDC